MQFDRGPGASELASAQISGPPVTVAHPPRPRLPGREIVRKELKPTRANLISENSSVRE